MNIQQTTSNKRKRGWLHQPLSLLCPDLTAWFKIKIKEICQHAFPQLRRILNCCGFYSASIWECQTNHEWGGYWAVCGSAVWILWPYFTNSKSTKPVLLWQRLSPYQFYFMLGTGTNTCHHTLGQKGKTSSFISSSCTQTFQACSKHSRARPCKSKSQWSSGVKFRVPSCGYGKLFFSNGSYMENQEQIRWIFIIQK